jgi:hypothetical protein
LGETTPLCPRQNGKAPRRQLALSHLALKLLGLAYLDEMLSITIIVKADDGALLDEDMRCAVVG